MGGTPQPWTLAIREVLADGEWHPHEEVLARAMQTVPPGRAVRRWENQQRSYYKRKKEAQPKVSRRATDEMKMQTGARALIQDSLSNLERYGWIETERPNGGGPHSGGGLHYRLRSERAPFSPNGQPTTQNTMTRLKLTRLIRAARLVAITDQAPPKLQHLLVQAMAICQEYLDAMPDLRRETRADSRPRK